MTTKREVIHKLIIHDEEVDKTIELTYDGVTIAVCAFPVCGGEDDVELLLTPEDIFNLSDWLKEIQGEQ